ncbi:MAG: single-stranded DNA-binding protein [Anaerolineales bacterium]
MFMEIILVGNVGRTPELRFTNSGQAVCDFSLAVNRRYRSGDRDVDETTWFRVTVWGKQAEIVNQYISKGRQVLVIADRIQASAYLARDNNEPRASLEVTARQVRFLGGRGDGDSSGGGGYSGGGYEEEDYNAPNVDDIPF